MNTMWVYPLMYLIASAGNVLFFAFGVRIGRNAGKKETGDRIPPKGITKALQSHRAQKEGQRAIDREQERLAKVLENIENYNGTEQGQKEV